MIINLQIMGIVFAILLFYLSYASFKKKDFDFNDFILWGGVSSILLIITIFYDKFYFIFNVFHIQGALWFLTIGGMFFLFILIFYLHRNLKKTQRKLEKIVRFLALKKIK